MLLVLAVQPAQGVAACSIPVSCLSNRALAVPVDSGPPSYYKPCRARRSPETAARSMNATGQIAGNYHAAGGFILPFSWDPTATGTDGVNITAQPSGSTASANAIGNNREIVGAGKTASGDVHAFDSLRGATSNDEGTFPGGSNSSAVGITPSGTTAVGMS